MEIDIERKKELVMEKKLRACRVNIIPRNGSYFESPTPTRTKTPSTPSPPPMTPSPESVEKASNPIALRYWTQCVEKQDLNSSSPTSTPSSPRVWPRQEPQQQNVEVVKILSTAGMGIKRDNEVSEARNNINRFITIDKVRKKDGVRLQRSQSQTRPQDNQNHLQQSRSYNLVKEEQIRLSQERSNFQNRNNFVAKSPQPFRRGLSESRDTRFLQPQIPKQQNSEITAPVSNIKSSGWNLNNLSQEVSELNDNHKTQLVLLLLNQLPQDVVNKIIAEKLSSMSDTGLYSFAGILPDKTVSAVVPMMFPRVKNDVKLSLVLESVPKLTKILRQN